MAFSALSRLECARCKSDYAADVLQLQHHCWLGTTDAGARSPLPVSAPGHDA